MMKKGIKKKLRMKIVNLTIKIGIKEANNIEILSILKIGVIIKTINMDIINTKMIMMEFIKINMINILRKVMTKMTIILEAIEEEKEM